MANSFVTAKQVSSAAIELLARNIVLPQTVTMAPAGEFSGPSGGTVTIRIPQPGSSNTRSDKTEEITYDDVTEANVDLSMEYIYHATRLAHEELTLELVDFAAQVTDVQVDAVARGAENKLASEMNGLDNDEDAVGRNADDIEAAILAAREDLSKNDVPAGNRYIAHGPEVTSELLKIDKFVRVDASGDDNALRQAMVGQLYGFTFVESNALDPDIAVAYHRSGFAMANKRPVVSAPGGGQTGMVDTASATQGPLTLTQVFQWDARYAATSSMLATFAGSKVVDEDRIFKFQLEA